MNSLVLMYVVLNILVNLDEIPAKSYHNKYDVRDLKWHCDSICAGTAGGVVEFDKETAKCRCTIGKDADDIDRNLMLKNAKMTGVKLEILDPSHEMTLLRKRSVETSEKPAEKSVDAPPTVGASPPKKPDIILPQKAISAKRAEEISANLESIRAQLLVLIGKVQTIDKRTLLNEVEAARRNLRKIALDDDRVSAFQQIKEKHFSLMPRLLPIKRSLMDETKATGMKENSSASVSDIDDDIPIRHSPAFAVITQPPDLIDE